MFETKGERPQWEIVYDRLAGMEIGEVISYEDLMKILGASSVAGVRTPFYKAVREIEDQKKRTFDVVKGVGYRMVETPEHEGLARRHHKKARRSLTRSVRKMHSADREKLSPEMRRAFDKIEDHLRWKLDVMNRRVSKVEDRQAVIEKDTATVSDKLDRMMDLLRRHGITDD